MYIERATEDDPLVCDIGVRAAALVVGVSLAPFGCGGKGNAASDGPASAAPPNDAATATPQQAATPRTTMQDTAGATRSARLGRARSKACTRTPGGRPSSDVAIALGDGPVFPVLGMEKAPPARRGVAVLEGDTHHGGLYLHKTLWALSPSASDVVVRGRSLWSGDRVGFYFPTGADEPRSASAIRRATHAALPLSGAGGGGWSYAPSTTVLPGPGCYAFDVRRPDASERIVFRAVLRRP